MKNIFLILSVLFISIGATKAQLSFTITNATGSPSITCNNPQVNLVFNSNYTLNPVTYTVTPANFTVVGNNYSFTSPGVYTIVAYASGSLSSTQSYTIFQNTTVPTSTITPAFQSITCANPIVQSVSVSATPSISVEHQFYWGSPSNGNLTGINSPTAVITPGPGTHTYVLINLQNGCKVIKTFTVAQGSGFPTFNITSPIQNFSVGCVPKHIADINIVNANTDPLGGILNYTILPPGFSGPYNSNSQASYTFMTPGIYTVVVKDVVSGCETKVPISIIQNTIGPQKAISALTQTLSCFNPSVLLQGSSTTANTSFQWHYTGAPIGVVPGNNFTVNTTANSNQTVVGTYSLYVKDNNNACVSFSFYPIYQNIIPPHALIASSGGPAIITCLNPTVTLVNSSTTGIPPNTFSNNLSVIATLWQGPSPQIPLSNSSTYLAYVPGTYTLNAQDLNNGCNSSTVFIVNDGRNYPVIINPGTFTIGCPGPSIQIYANIIGNPGTSYACQWIGSGGLINSPTVTSTSALVTTSATVNAQGSYTLTVTNLITNCSSSLVVPVYGCVGINENGLNHSNINVFPNPNNGSFNLSIPKNNKGVLIKIYNAQGALVKEQILDPDETGINIEKEANGFYTIQIFQENDMLYHSRFIKE